MRHVVRNVFRGAFGALVVAGLGFGGGQALASPAEAQGAASCTMSEERACLSDCRVTYGFNYRGQCTKDVDGTVNCYCIKLGLS